MARVLLAVNTRARRGRDARDLAAAALRARGHEIEMLESNSPEELARGIAAKRGTIDVAAIGGGDGTLISAIEGVRGADVPMLILPLGTINELSRTLAIPFDIEAACALIDEGDAHPIDAARVNGTWFFNEASIGLSTHVAREQTGEVKSRWGMLAIPIATLRSLRGLRWYHFDVESDLGERRRFHTVQLTVANSYRFGGVVENPDAEIDDGMLDLYSIDLKSWWSALDVLAAVVRKKFPQADCVQTMRGHRFTVTSRRPHSVFADGEPATKTPAEFTIVPGAIRVFVPRKPAAVKT
ncbi:MAG: lipid kinase [Candidatus Velthaea sp.]